MSNNGGWSTHNPLGFTSFEEQLERRFAHLGPFKAVDRREDWSQLLPPLGAERMRLGDSEWQTVVAAQIARSKVVVMILGATTGLQWELDQVIEQNLLGQLVVVARRSVTKRWTGGGPPCRKYSPPRAST